MNSPPSPHTLFVYTAISPFTQRVNVTGSRVEPCKAVQNPFDRLKGRLNGRVYTYFFAKF